MQNYVGVFFENRFFNKKKIDLYKKHRKKEITLR